MELEQYGYAVLSLKQWTTETLVNAYFREAVESFLEFNKISVFTENENEYKPLVLGGFGALANPGSFHAREIQDLRLLTYYAVSEYLFNWLSITNKIPDAEKGKYKLESLFDRMCIRNENQGKVSREAWHRDIYSYKVQHEKWAYKDRLDKEECKKSLPNDIFLGGFVNCNNSEDMYFSCVPGMYGLFQNSESGFDRISETEHAYLNARKQAIKVPPCHVIIFFQGIVHEINPNATVRHPDDVVSCRLFVGHRLTHDNDCLFGKEVLDSWIENGAVPRIPSGQIPPAWSKSHITFFRQRIAKYMENVRCHFNYASDAHRYFPSLKAMHLPVPRYSDCAYACLFPHTLAEISEIFARSECIYLPIPVKMDEE